MADKLLVVHAKMGLWETQTRFPFLANPILLKWQTLYANADIGDHFGFVMAIAKPYRQGPQQWVIEIHREVRADEPPLFYRKVDVSPRGDNIALRHAVRNMPNCFIAVGETEYSRFRSACDAEAIAIEEVFFDDTIFTGPLL